MNDDDLLNRAIVRAVRGETSPWDIDRAYPTKDALGKPITFEERFKAGDKQILLWAIWDYADRGKPTPKWAADALHEVLMRAAKFEFGTWDDAFGKIPARGTHRTRVMDRVRFALPVGRKLRKLSNARSKPSRKGSPGIASDHLMELANTDEFPHSFYKLKDFWKFYREIEKLFGGTNLA